MVSVVACCNLCINKLLQTQKCIPLWLFVVRTNRRLADLVVTNSHLLELQWVGILADVVVTRLIPLAARDRVSVRSCGVLIGDSLLFVVRVRCLRAVVDELGCLSIFPFALPGEVLQVVVFARDYNNMPTTLVHLRGVNILPVRVEPDFVHLLALWIQARNLHSALEFALVLLDLAQLRHISNDHHTVSEPILCLCPLLGVVVELRDSCLLLASKGVATVRSISKG